MVDSTIQIFPQSTGPLVDCQLLTNASAQLVNRQTVCTGDPLSIGSIQTVRAGSTNAIQSDGAAVVLLRPDGLGSVGVDYSANEPAFPNIGAAQFPNSGPYALWFLLTTVPANQTRAKIMIDNMSTGPMLVLFDDGTALAGTQPNNSTAFILNPKVTTGPEGGHFESTTKRGRAQIYSASNTSWVSASID